MQKEYSDIFATITSSVTCYLLSCQGCIGHLFPNICELLSHTHDFSLLDSESLPEQTLSPGGEETSRLASRTPCTRVCTRNLQTTLACSPFRMSSLSSPPHDPETPAYERTGVLTIQGLSKQVNLTQMSMKDIYPDSVTVSQVGPVLSFLNTYSFPHHGVHVLRVCLSNTLHSQLVHCFSPLLLKQICTCRISGQPVA